MEIVIGIVVLFVACFVATLAVIRERKPRRQMLRVKINGRPFDIENDSSAARSLRKWGGQE